MARGHPVSPPDAVSLPIVSFTIVSDEISKLPAGVRNKAAIPFGYNDFSDFSRPSSYVRHIEPLESDLAKTVEYDMDEQDEEWLNAVNEDRRKNQLDKIDQELFEIMMDRLEKEWFDLTKNLQKPDLAMPSEDSTCAICDDSEGENSNAIVFCDGCNLAVHQDCYGVPYIPEGQWLCRKCTVSPENPVECILCPNEGGAFKQTLHGEWVHLLCAIWIPETRVANEVFMEPITGVNKISKPRWKLKCSICDVRAGACIQCAKSSCFLAFHATCARKEKFLLPMKSAHGAEPVTLTCYCERHLPQEQQVARTAALEAEEAHEHTAHNSQLAAKSARAYAKTYKPGPPLVPAIVVDRIMLYTDKLRYRKKIDFARMLCRYWSLKREARRGAPLLKRLHLEPWTASAGAKVQTEEDKLMRLDQLNRLRQDLVNVKALTQLSWEREGTKHRQTEIVHDILVAALLPLYASLRSAFERIMSFDKKDHFKNPVSKIDVPDYFDVIENPMCWTMIETKINKFEYWDFHAFRHDVELVINNAIMYNKAGTQFHKDATRIQKESGPILNDVQKLVIVHNLPLDSNGEVEDKTPGFDKLPPIGDLEPPLDVLELLISSESFKEDLYMEVGNNPVVTLFNYELATWKPPPLDPEDVIRSRKEKNKPKRDRKAEVERAKANKEAGAAGASIDVREAEEKEEIERRREQEKEFQAALDSSSGFRIPRTRSALAAAAAFEAEARGSSATADDVGSATESSKANKSRKRASVAPVGQTSVPRVVNDVGNRDSFNMFNAGWILPPDQKRGGRASALDRAGLPPPRKRARTDHGTSRLSIVSTAASDNLTLLLSEPIEVKHNPNEPTDIPMDVDGSEDEGQQGRSNSKVQLRKLESVPLALSMDDEYEEEKEKERPHNVVKQPNGVVVIEKLDTPATRREKNQRRKAEKQKMAAQTGGDAISAGSSNNLSVTQLSQPPPLSATSQARRPLRLRLTDDMESELSELSDLASEELDKIEEVATAEKELKDEHETDRLYPEDKREKEREVMNSPSKPEQSLPKKDMPKSKESHMGDFPGGTLVWAKADSFPWWPAVVHTPTSHNIPRNIYQAWQEKTARRNIQLFIVQFYDKQESWQSVPINKLELLGEDTQLDNENLTSSTKQKWKPSASKQQCREAYERAMSEMIPETEGDDGEASVDNINL